jgi:Ca2+-transporting ATPase
LARKENKEQNGFHTLSNDEVAERLGADTEKGLTSSQAKKRRGRHGPNKLREKKQKSLWQLLFDQLKSAVIYLLAAAVIVSFLFGDIPEAIAIIAVILINTIIGFGMEFQARKSMKALQKMDRLTSLAFRDGEEVEIDAEEIVPGDIVYLKPGFIVPADGRVIESSELQVNEAALTGESIPANKSTEAKDSDTPLADRSNMIYKGTTVTMGKGKVIVTATGMDTELGSISEMVSAEKKESVPLNIKLNKLSKRLVWMVLAMAATYGTIGYLTGKDLHIIAQTSIAWAIAAIPEGLAIVATIALARGMMRLARDQVIVKQLSTVETLGEATVILTDKTGTLTKNQLSLSELYFDEGRKEVEHIKVPTKENSLAEQVLKVLFLCNNAELKEDGEGKGDMLEIATLQFGRELEEGIVQRYRDSYRRIEEDPFDSESMMMSTLHQKDKNLFTAAKGAAEPILKRCDSIRTGDKVSKLTPGAKDKILEMSNEMSSDGLRTIALACKEPEKRENYDEGLTFVGLAGYIDPPQKDVEEAIRTCRKAGVHVVMVTGDHPETARNIARRVAIIDDAGAAVFTGKDMNGYDDKDEDGKRRFADARVFARVDPGQKLSILKRFQESGEIAGMTGDGVNDTPALKRADIGIAMGHRGTQAAREIADMVLKNDDFPSIVTAIRQGRIIFNNIRKFIIYQLSYHLAEIIVIAAVSFSIFYLPLLPLQLLFLNLLTDVFPALALGIGKGRGKVLQERPKDPEEPILTKRSWKEISLYGAIIGIFVTGAYFFALYSLGVPKEIANNVAFFALAFTQLFHVFNMRDRDEKIIVNQVTTNKWVWMAIVFCTLVLFTAYFTPGLNALLSFQPMGLGPWSLVAITTVVSVCVIQAVKELKLI